jgi:O-antigen ligase
VNSTAKPSDSSSAGERPSAVEYGFWLFLAIAVGRVNQLIPGLSSLPLAKLAVVIAGAAFLSDKNKRNLPALSINGRKLLKTGIAMACLAVLLTPLSIWPGASRHFVLFGLPPLIVATTIACSMRRSWQSLRGTLLVLLLCGFVLGALATLHSHGRADDSSTDYDPNDLAYVLVTVVPLGLAFFNFSDSWIRKLVYAIVTMVTGSALVLTGSRGGMLGFLTILLLMVFLPLGVSAPSKRLRSLRSSIAIAAVIASAGIAVWSQMPHSSQQRYMTLLHLNSDYNADLKDKSGRESVWIRGLHAFMKRPIGYGPQTYQMVDFMFGGDFKAPHNSYLQALVELGPLGLWFLLRMYLLTLHELQKARSNALILADAAAEQKERAVLVRALQYGLLGNMVAGFFLSDAYSMLPWVIFGLTAAITALPVQQPIQPKLLSQKPGSSDHPTERETSAPVRRGRSLRTWRQIPPR